MRLNFSRGGGGRKFSRVQRHANIYEFASDTDLGHREICKYDFFLVRHSSLGMKSCNSVPIVSVSFLPEYLQIILENLPH